MNYALQCLGPLIIECTCVHYVVRGRRLAILLLLRLLLPHAQRKSLKLLTVHLPMLMRAISHCQDILLRREALLVSTNSFPTASWQHIDHWMKELQLVRVLCDVLRLRSERRLQTRWQRSIVCSHGHREKDTSIVQ